MKLKLKSVELVEENNQFYLDAVYLKEEDGIKSEIRIPRIEIPFIRRDTDDGSPHPYGSVTRSYDGFNREVSIDFGRGELPIREWKDPTGQEMFYYEQYLEREMTVADIEKRLGHKIKIVGED